MGNNWQGVIDTGGNWQGGMGTWETDKGTWEIYIGTPLEIYYSVTNHKFILRKLVMCISVYIPVLHFLMHILLCIPTNQENIKCHYV